MARAARKKKPVSGDNSTHPEVLKSILAKYDGIQAEMASRKGKFMKEMQGLQSDAKDVLKEAKAHGIGMKPLKVSIKIRDLGRKMTEAREDLEQIDNEEADRILAAMQEFEESFVSSGQASAKDDDDLANSLANNDQTEDD